ncbi:hypothetical protein LCGC14_2639220 [marine sediment metagenome]|uniref:Uncharacterized protein n=1 Tax=marine sediment metagenome TaxID=412755 RepID=A0A0F8ZXY7_9ZZZZ
MDMIQQVCSLELAQALKAVGVKQDSTWYWVDVYPPKTALAMKKDGVYFVYDPERLAQQIVTGGDPVSAFTVAELGEMLPTLCLSGSVEKGRYNCWYFADMCTREIKHYNTYQTENEANARAKMLMFLVARAA